MNDLTERKSGLAPGSVDGPKVMNTTCIKIGLTMRGVATTLTAVRV